MLEMLMVSELIWFDCIYIYIYIYIYIQYIYIYIYIYIQLFLYIYYFSFYFQKYKLDSYLALINNLEDSTFCLNPPIFHVSKSIGTDRINID